MPDNTSRTPFYWLTQWQFFDTLRQDISFAFRVLWKNPAFSMISIVALALGIGANSTIYSSLKAMVLHPLPFKQLSRILTVGETLPRQGINGVGWDGISLAPANYRDLADRNTVFERMAAFQGRGWDANISGSGTPERLEGYLVTPSFFPLLDTAPFLGRTFTESEDQNNKDVRQAVISYSAWQRHFGADPGILGRTVVLNGSQATIIGVMPAEFDFPAGTEIWAPLSMTSPEMSSRGDHTLAVIGRLRPEASLQQARAQLDTIAANLAQQYPATNAERGFSVGLLEEDIIGPSHPYLVILMWSAVFVLLLACANVANLQLARAIGHQRELAVRTALGASRWRIASQVLAESCMLSLGGGIGGLLLATWSIPVTRASVPDFIVQHVNGIKNIKLDGGVIFFTAAIAVLTGILAGLLPVWQACSTRDLTDALKQGVRGTSGTTRRRSRSLLVVTEVALALILLVGASLMLKGFRGLANRYPGYEATNSLSMRVTLPEKSYPTPRARADFYDRAVEKLAAIPGVEAAAAVKFLPSGWSWQSGNFAIENVVSRPNQEPRAGMQSVSPDFFRVLRMPLRSGRFITAQDGADSLPVVVISAAMSRRYWSSGDPIGHRIRFGTSEPWRTIVGVVDDIRQSAFDVGFRPIAYIPITQAPPQTAGFILRTTGDPMALVGSARTALQSVDRNQPAYDFRTLQQLITDSTSGVQYSARMMSAFALIALVLAAAGIYAVMAYAVVQRTHEIGVRMALGAQHGHVLRMIIGNSVKLAAGGLAIGVPISFVMMRGLSSLLVGVIQLDIPILVALTAMLALVAVLAGYLPARRAAQVDPMAALRVE
ncbi:MAG TPA: ABC transporter permease [Candidatus Angelobacter sp.]|nr:ABC transporter permease [Candidatus Angelobacter sp.]